MLKFIEVRTAFFRPLYRRIVVVLVTAAWGLVEFSLGNLIWCAVFLVAAVYLAWAFFIAFEQGPVGKDSD